MKFTLSKNIPVFISLFTGLPDLKEGVDGSVLKELRRVADIFYLPRLKDIADNIDNEEEFLNPSIGTYLNDRMGARAKELFLGKETFADVKFNIQGELINQKRNFSGKRKTNYFSVPQYTLQYIV